MRDPARPRDDSWPARAALLRQLLEAHDAADCDYRADLGRARFWWQSKRDGRPLVVAEARVLCSYALSNRTLLAAWANAQLPAVAAVAAVHDVVDVVDDADEADAWAYACAIADGCGAEFVYRAPNPQTWVFLGLWNVRAAADDDDAFVAAAPWPHARAVVGALLRVVDPAHRRTLARNYGRSFEENALVAGTAWEAPLRAAGRQLMALAERDDDDDVDAGLAALLESLPAD